MPNRNDLVKSLFEIQAVNSEFSRGLIVNFSNITKYHNGTYACFTNTNLKKKKLIDLIVHCNLRKKNSSRFFKI